MCTVHRVKGLVQEKPDGPGCVHPGGHILIEGRVVPQQGEEVDDDKAEAGQGDLKQKGENPPPQSVKTFTQKGNFSCKTHGVGSREGRSAGMVRYIPREKKGGEPKGFGANLRHGHGEALDHDVVVERLEHVLRRQGVVDPGVLVVVQAVQLLLANVDHLCLTCGMILP